MRTPMILLLASTLSAVGCTFDLRAPPLNECGDCYLPGGDGSASGDAVGGGDGVAGGDDVSGDAVAGDSVGGDAIGNSFFTITWPDASWYRTPNSPIRILGACSTDMGPLGFVGSTVGTWVDSDCSDGSWSADVDLAPGDNAVEFSGLAGGGLSISVSRTIHYDIEANIAITSPNNGADYVTTARSVVLMGTCDNDIINIQTPSSGILGSNDCVSSGGWSFEATTLVPGDNLFQVIATDDFGNQSAPVGINITRLDAGGHTRVEQIVVGDAHSCALLADGQVFCWGDNSSSQIGDTSGSTAPRLEPSPVDTGNLNGSRRFVQISAGSRHTCGVRADGRVACWGDNSYGQLGVGDQDPHAALQAVQVNANEVRMKKVSAGGGHTCGLTFDGTIICWGGNGAGQLGNGTSGISVSVEPGALDITGAAASVTFTDVAAGYNHTCALSGEGKVLCWGANGSGEAGNGTNTTPLESPTTVVATNLGFAVAITAGNGHSCAIASDGHAYCWGYNGSGELGKHGGSSATSPVHVDSLGPLYRALSAGDEHTCGITEGGVAHCWGTGALGRLGDGSTAGYLDPVPVSVNALPRPHGFRSIAAGAQHSCAITADGIAVCWGSSGWGRLGATGVGSIVATPELVETQSFPTGRVFSAITVGIEHACALDDAGVAFCWGSNAEGQLGNGDSTSSQPTPTRVWETQLLGETRLRDIAAGNLHTCAVSWDGRMLCWGNNSRGEAGQGDTVTPVTVPRPVPFAPPGDSPHWQQVAAGGSGSCGIMGDGLLYCWGGNNRGQIGAGPGHPDPSPSPVPVWLTDRVTGQARQHIEVGIGAEHACATAADGLAYCWGADDDGALGVAAVTTQTDRPQRVEVNGLAASAGELRRGLVGGTRLTCATSTMGRASCWGDNGLGQVGAASDTTPHPLPVAVDTGGSGLRWLELAAGTSHACGRRDDGTAHCWGSNAQSQLGLGTLGGPPAKSPGLVVTSDLNGEEFWVQIAAGGATNCGLSSDAIIYCWGNGTSGQTGTDTGVQPVSQPAAVDVSALD